MKDVEGALHPQGARARLDLKVEDAGNECATRCGLSPRLLCLSLIGTVCFAAGSARRWVQDASPRRRSVSSAQRYALLLSFVSSLPCFISLFVLVFLAGGPNARLAGLTGPASRQRVCACVGVLQSMCHACDIVMSPRPSAAQCRRAGISHHEQRFSFL